MEQPNVILINCDDLGYGDLGCYGSEINRTPAVDNLAKEGIRFTDFYMASPVCSPSRGAMLTGCYPQRISFGLFDGELVLFPGHGIGLNTSEVTIATLLKQSGYATKLVGKWHCGDQPEFLPTRHGFDSYYGLPYSNDMGIQVQNVRNNPPLPLLMDEEVLQEQPDQTSLTERYVEQSVRFMRENAGRPFFLYLAHMHVHVPHYAPECFVQRSQNGRYGAAVECIDWSVVTIMDELKHLGIDENTLVIFTSDNGSRLQGQGGSNGVLRGQKGMTWEGGLRVPCIMRWPVGIQAGRVSSELVTALDLLPTLAEIGGASLPEKNAIDGLNMLPLLYSDDAKSPRKTFFYYLANNLEAVRHNDWKLHVYKHDWVAKVNGPVQELYNLKDDPSETNNVYDAYPEIVVELSAMIEGCRRDLGDELTGVKGTNVRPIGRVDHPVTLTHYDPEHPYIIAMYDLPERG